MNRIFFSVIFVMTIGMACAQQLKVMTYNIHFAQDMNGKADASQTAAVINKYKPDIVMLQEVDSVTKRTGSLDQMSLLGTLTGMHYQFGRHFPFDGGAYGLGILSKYPIDTTIFFRLPYYTDDANGNTRLMLITRVILSKKRKLYVASVHLDYKKDSMRVVQARELAAWCKSLGKSPAIVAGDFNASPEKESVKNMNDCFVALQPMDTTATFPADNPKIKIDYIFLSANARWKVKQQKVIPEKQVSDHRPFMMVVKLKK